MTVVIRKWFMKLAIWLTFGLLLKRVPIDSVSRASWLLVTLDLFAFSLNEERLPTSWNYRHIFLEYMMFSTSLNSGVASRIPSAEWTTKRLISKITSHIESTLFAFLIKQSVSLDVRTSSFSKFSGLIILREKLPGSMKIVFEWNTPPSFRRPLNLGTRFFRVGASCHIPSSGMLKAS